MKILLLCFSLLAFCQNVTAEVEWLTSVSAAMDRARIENKTVLLDFTGSDWCGWCKRLKSEVFDQPEFASYAQAHLIMVEVDFPRHKALSPEQSAANQKLAQRFNIHSFPSIVLIDSIGNQVGASHYVPGGPKSFIASLESNPGYAHHVPAVADARPEPAAPHVVPKWDPPAPAAPMKYGDLKLKAISGAKNHRMVLINNETLMLGETAKIKVHDQRVQVTVKEIRDDSVVILADGKTTELVIGDR